MPSKFYSTGAACVRISCFALVGVIGCFWPTAAAVTNEEPGDVYFEHSIGHPLFPDVPCRLGAVDTACQIDTGSTLTVVDIRFRKFLPQKFETVKATDAGDERVSLDLFESPPLTIKSYSPLA